MLESYCTSVPVCRATRKRRTTSRRSRPPRRAAAAWCLWAQDDRRYHLPVDVSDADVRTCLSAEYFCANVGKSACAGAPAYLNSLSGSSSVVTYDTCTDPSLAASNTSADFLALHGGSATAAGYEAVSCLDKAGAFCQNRSCCGSAPSCPSRSAPRSYPSPSTRRCPAQTAYRLAQSASTSTRSDPRSPDAPTRLTRVAATRNWFPPVRRPPRGRSPTSRFVTQWRPTSAASPSRRSSVPTRLPPVLSATRRGQTSTLCYGTRGSRPT